jgi:hypothetical protein
MASTIHNRYSLQSSGSRTPSNQSEARGLEIVGKSLRQQVKDCIESGLQQHATEYIKISQIDRRRTMSFHAGVVTPQEAAQWKRKIVTTLESQMEFTFCFLPTYCTEEKKSYEGGMLQSYSVVKCGHHRAGMTVPS